MIDSTTAFALFFVGLCVGSMATFLAVLAVLPILTKRRPTVTGAGFVRGEVVPFPKRGSAA